MKKLQIILAVILGLMAIGGAVYKFDFCKVEKVAYAKFVAKTDNQFLQNHRRYIQSRIWELQRTFPQTYLHMREYKELAQELSNIDMKINAYYQKKGK